MSNYWAKRLEAAQQVAYNQSQKAINKRLRKYYQSLASRVVADYESVYNQVLAATQAGEEISPAKLYQLDKYWQMQGQLRGQLNKFGEKQIAQLTKQFEIMYFETYYSLQLDGLTAYTTIDNKAVQQIINQIWCADGKSWSQRIWENTQLLKETLDEGLIHCIVTGKKTTELKNILQERFNVSYSRADTLVRTELAHIQTQAAQQRYKDYGIAEVEVLVEKDERLCDICRPNNGKRYKINERMPVPFHPNCRCCMIPVVE